MKSLLEFILIHLVDNPDQIEIISSTEEDTEVYTIHVAPDDMGKVIGKSGKVINAIRQIARVRAMKEQKHVLVRLEDTVVV